MPFEPVRQKTKPYSRISVVRFAVVRTPTMKVGRLSIPPSIINELGWKHHIEMQVMAGTNEDAGWYQVRPSAVMGEARQRAKLKIETNGVGHYSTQALVPPDLQGPLNSMQPETRLDGNTLYVKLF
jgi:hypothetical protein